jgi:DNA polymerase-3 subunit delta
MVKIATRDIERFIGQPDPAVRAVVVYGPDEGLVRERSERLARAVVSDPTDPFGVVELSPTLLAGAPGRLAEEAAAIAFGGGRRLVRVRGPGELATAPLEAVLKHAIGDAFILIEAGNLGPRAPLRRVAENAKSAAAIPCYLDSAADLERLILSSLRDAGLTAEPDAIAHLLAHLGGDRQMSRREIEKLVLYMGAEGPREVSLADARAVVGDVSELTLEDIAYAVAEGDRAALERRLQRSLNEGVNPVRVLRGVGLHLNRLELAVAARDGGASVDQAIRALRPPLFFKRTGSFKNQLTAWSTDRLGAAREILLAAEIDCKTTGFPAAAACGRALMRLAQAARPPRS